MQRTAAPRETSRVRRLGVVAAIAIALFVVLWSVHAHYPLQRWLVLRYGAYWGLAALWSLGCVAAGHATLRLILGRSLPVLQQLAVSFALGVFEFQLAMFGLGLLRLYGTVVFFGLPLLMLALGAVPGLQYLQRLRRAGLFRVLGHRAPPPRAYLVLAFGVLALAAIYLPTMLPGNVAFDSRWRHMMLAEQYAVYGGLRRFGEGWVFAASPHFSVLLYSWAFLLPDGALLFDRMELAAHLEVVCFLWTTWVGVPALVRSLAPGVNPLTIWVVRLLFPGVLLYDSSLCGGIDHIGALFAPALFILCIALWQRFEMRTGVLLAALIAAALCAKETTGLLLAPGPLLLGIVRSGVEIRRKLRGGAGRAFWSVPLASAGGLLVLTAPHWLKNLIWYGNPVYPSLAKWFWPEPWIPHANYILRWPFLELGLWPAPPGLDGVKQTLIAQLRFAFEPHDWWAMHRDVPVFGFLYTVLLLALLFLRRTRRIWLLVGFAQTALVVWFIVHHEDRYLQTIMPWIAAVTGAIIVRILQTQRLFTRALLIALIGVQVAWGADVYFYPTHFMFDTAPIKAVADFLGQGYLGNFEQRLEVSGQLPQQQVGAHVSRRAVLLVHEHRAHLGFARPTVTDFYGDQYGIDYTSLDSADRIAGRLRELGVTHLVWEEHLSHAFAPLAADLAFFEFAYRHARNRRKVDRYLVAAMPRRVPAAPSGPAWVAVLGCGRQYESGVYMRSDLSVPRFGPRSGRYPKPRRPLPRRLLQDPSLDAIVVDTTCHAPIPRLTRSFVLAARPGFPDGPSYELWLRGR